MEKTKTYLILKLINKNEQTLKEKLNYYKNTNKHMRTKEVLMDLINETKLLNEIHYDLSFVKAIKNEPKLANSLERLYEKPKKVTLEVANKLLDFTAEQLGLMEDEDK